jgi:hypothetical protein
MRSWQQRRDAVIRPRVVLQTVALAGLLTAGLQEAAP